MHPIIIADLKMKPNAAEQQSQRCQINREATNFANLDVGTPGGSVHMMYLHVRRDEALQRQLNSCQDIL